MTTRVAINDFGWIGRLCLRSMLERQQGLLSVVVGNEKNASLHPMGSMGGLFWVALACMESVRGVPYLWNTQAAAR